MKKRTIITATAVAVACAGIVAGVVLSSGSNMTVHGILEDCTQNVSTGEQVTVTDSSGTVIGTSSVTDTGQGTVTPAWMQTFGGAPAGTEKFKFTITVPTGEVRYGINIGDIKPTIWFSQAEMQKGPGLTNGC